MDIQELPAVRGGKGREYKISLIHLRTRIKYSEIHHQVSSRVVAQVLERACSRLPPFFLVVTDNALVFTMRFAHHKDRQTAFQKQVAALGLRHFCIAPRSPWQNGFIERSNRTDNEECFTRQQFTCSEQRRLVHRLWEMHYNSCRPHQGLGGQRPEQVFARQYRWHAPCRLNPMAFRRPQ
jgi:transposase InsO family protein